MQPNIDEIKLSEVIFDSVIYPRKNHDPALVQKYAEVLPEIELKQNFISVASDNKLLDGKHRWLAYRKTYENADPIIKVFRYNVSTPHEQLKLATELNNQHGWQLTDSDKKITAISLHNYGNTDKEIAAMLSVGDKKVAAWLKETKEDEQDKQNELIFDMYLASYTQTEIAETVGLPQQTVADQLKVLPEKRYNDKPVKLLAEFEDEDFTAPLFNVWSFGKKTNITSHFGNSEQRIVENLLYLYTNPFDIVFDPFAGGGSTIDVCQKRLRRYFVSDRKPIVEREKEIRLLDIAQELPSLHNRWSDVTLTYLDPPYWKQAEGKYSNDPEDLANMPLEQFTKTLIDIVNRIATKQKQGIIALLIQPTQWKSENKDFTDHVMDVLKGVNLKVENRVSCPYSTEQYNAQQVEWAKENRKLLVISRELIIWEIK